MNKDRLGLPLLLSFMGTLLSLTVNKKYHIWLGAAFSLLGAMHTWQHRQSLQREFCKERRKVTIFSFGKEDSGVSPQMSYFLRQVQVLHYIPGRIRLHSRYLVGNPALAQQVENYLSAIAEITQVSVNVATGSILLTYSPEAVSQNPVLCEIEQMVRRQYGR